MGALPSMFMVWVGMRTIDGGCSWSPLYRTDAGRLTLMPTVPECLTAVTRQKGHERMARRCSVEDSSIILFQGRWGLLFLDGCTRKVYNEKLEDADIEEANVGISLCTRQQKVG